MEYIVNTLEYSEVVICSVMYSQKSHCNLIAVSLQSHCTHSDSADEHTVMSEAR